MTVTTVRELAEVVGIPVDRLLVQLGESGLPHDDAEQRINDTDKAQLLSHLRHLHGKTAAKSAAPKKISLRRKSVSELKIASSPSTSLLARRKTVTVEVRKRRSFAPGSGAGDATAEHRSAVETQERMDAAKKALQEEAKRRQQELDESLREEAEQRDKEEALRKLREPEKRKRPDEPAPVQATEEIAAPAPVQDPAALQAQEQAAAVKKSSKKGDARKGERAGRRGDKTRRSREELHVASEKRGRRRKKPRARPVIRSQPSKHGFEMPTAPMVREIAIPETITVASLAQKLSIKVGDLIKTMMNLGSMVTINQAIDQDTAAVVVEELGHAPKLIKDDALEDQLIADTSDTRETTPRSPVVTIMGHVDHGKTSLLDYIRSTKVAAGEAGGITQHIGAYRVETDKGTVTFLDTPGHAAFTAMRARGAKATDIVVLVVAADDGVMPQTVEAIQHAKSAEVPIVVAVNKIDRAEADPKRIRQDLSSQGLIPEDWGGETMFVDVSAKTGEGIDALLESIVLQAEVLELRAPAAGPARGVVIESRLDKGRGTVATVLVQAGELAKGDIILAGQEFGRVRGLFDASNREIERAGPSVPVEVLGLSGPPNAGDDAMVLPDERRAREIATFRQGRHREVRLARQQAANLDSIFEQMTEGEVGELNLVVKADVQGSVEALRDALIQLSHEEVKVNVITSATGGISAADVNLAIASNAIVIGFNVRADASARRLVDAGNVDMHYFSVIYEVIDTVKQAVSGLLKPEFKEQIVGIAEVLEVFRSKKFGDVAGSRVQEGTVKRALPIRVLRDNVVIYEGELESLRRFQDDVSEVKAGTDCGIAVRNYKDVKVGDQIEVFERIQVERSI